MNKILKKVDLIASSDCDLKCSYCYITKNCAFSDYDKYIKKSWESKEYLKVIRQVLEKTNRTGNTVESLQFWGGEPTLHLHAIANCGIELGTMFPNITHFLIPTNWNNVNVYDLVDFIYNLDQGLNDRNNKSENCLNFHIQCSIDGPPDSDFNQLGHHVSWEKYKQNFDNFLSYIKNKKGKLKNTNIVFAICPTTTSYLFLKNFNTYDQISEFKQYLTKALNYANGQAKMIDNANIVIGQKTFTPRMAIPLSITTEQSVEFEKIIRLMEYYDYINNIELPVGQNEIQSFRDCKGESLITMRNHECPESNEESFTIMQDGTIAECPCTFLQHLPSYQEEVLKTKNIWDYKSTLIRAKSFYNPLTDTDEKKQYHDWYIYNGGYLGTQSTYANLNLSMAYEMALSHQIDYNYVLNPELLIKHYFANSLTSECYRENVNVTHNHLLADHNNFRCWYNGYTEYAYNNHYNNIKNYFNNILKEDSNADT